MPLARDIEATLLELDANLRRARALAAGLNNIQLNWRPSPEAWSVAQNLAHLNITNKQTIPALQRALAHGREEHRLKAGPFYYGWLTRQIVESMEPPVKRKIKTPKSFRPAQDIGGEAALQEYLDTVGQMRAFASSARGLDLEHIATTLDLLPAPFRWLYKMPLGARFSMITGHDRRHFWQAEQVVAHPAFPKQSAATGT